MITRHTNTYNKLIHFQIKEKSERSLPMPRQSMDAGDAASIRRYREDQEQRISGMRRQSGIPGSRGGSRPSSRQGSNLSLNSDDSPRGSNVRRTSSMRSGARTSVLSQQTPVGFGSSSPRRISTPVTNGGPRTGSNSSMDRNPMSGRYVSGFDEYNTNAWLEVNSPSCNLIMTSYRITLCCFEKHHLPNC